MSGLRPTGLKATAYDVAALAGVSQSAVSRAFTEGASISPAKRRKVLEAASVLGYRPNLLARSLTTRRSNIIGLAVGNLENPFFTTLLDALSTRLSAAGLRLLMFTARANAEVDAQIEEVLHYRVDALVLLSTFMSPSLVAQCRAAGVPMIFINRDPAIMGSGRGVTGDDEVGAAAIAAHFLEAGYRRMAFMAGVVDSAASRERERGFTRSLTGQGIDPPARREGGFTRAGATEAMRQLLSRPEPPDAVFCANDHMACAAIDVARAEFGLEPGRDIGIAGFDDVPMAGWPAYSLTTYTLPVAVLAEAVVRLILDHDEAVVGGSTTVIPGRLVSRSSTSRH